MAVYYRERPRSLLYIEVSEIKFRLKKKLKTFNIQEDFILLPLDMTLLFTNIPVQLVLNSLYNIELIYIEQASYGLTSRPPGLRHVAHNFFVSI